RALARSSPAAGQILDPILVPEPGGPRPDWSSLFEAAHRAAGLRDSLLISIDDFQWSDERSTALIHYLVRGAQADGDPLALVVGGRRSTTLSGLITSLERLLGEGLTRVTLGPLDHRSTVALARAVNPALDTQAAAAAADRAGGSPFWCELLARARDVDTDVARIVADRLATAGGNATVLLRASEATSRAGLDHLPLTLRIVRSPMRRLVGLDGLRSIATLIDLLPVDTPQERELQGELASLAAELGQHGLAM